MIGSMIPEALPHIADPAILEEADAFVRQEGQHAMAHRQHAKGLIRAYPALKQTLDKVVEAYDDLTANTPLKYRLAYTADLEATFTPVFKLMLDHDDTLFAPGDDRVASLFLWHFVEEVEHRSSALTIYDAVVDDPWYRMRAAPSIFKHVMGIIRMASEDFNALIPLADRKVDAMSTFRIARRKKALLQRLPFTETTYDGPFANAFSHLPLRGQLAAMSGVVRSQLPGHDPTHEKLPALAQEWFDRYDAGYDVTQWYTANDYSTANDGEATHF
jgi:predicted metal-dependent hydrolase